MKIDKATSERLSLLRFPLIVGVVFIHAYSTEVTLSTGSAGLANTGVFVDFFRNLISQGIARIAVPLFFLLSGYLFFLDFSFSPQSYKAKLESRTKTLLIPFLFWNILTLMLIAVAQYLPATQAFFSGRSDPISTFGPYDYINALFGIDRRPISYQFWFIRDLMVMVLLAPAVHFILKSAPSIFLVGFLSLWIIDIWPIEIPASVAVAFFYAGAYFANSNISLFALDRFGTPLLISYLAILLADILTKEYTGNIYLHNIGILFGVVSVLFVTKTLARSHYAKSSLLWASGCSFFVFAVHEPLLTVVRKIVYKALTPNSDAFILSLYFIIPSFVIALAVLMYVGMKSVAPRVLSVISGGR